MSLTYSQKYNDYKKAVVGSERSIHTFTKRLNTIQSLGRGIRGDILDIGCGYGFRTIGLAEIIDGNIVGIDIDPLRVKEANRYVDHKGIKNCCFKVMDAENLNLPKEKYDVVIADEMIHHVSNLQKVAQEMYRVLKKGGIALISDHNKWSLASEFVRLLYFGVNREKLYSAKDIKHCFKQIGFQKIKYKHILFTLPFHSLPKSILKINYCIEEWIERSTYLSKQCGVYVIRGIK